jgi:hypothetical protein
VDEERQWYAVDRELTTREDAEAVCAAVLDVLRAVLRCARVDVMSDHTDQMPLSVAAAESALRAQGWQQRPRDSDPVMAVEVTPADREWAALERYAAWSINVDLLAEDEHEVATLHDCGWSVTAALTDTEAEVLRKRLQPTAPLVALNEVIERRRKQKRDRRKQRLASLWPPLRRRQ